MIDSVAPMATLFRNTTAQLRKPPMPNQPTPHTFYTDPTIGLTVTAHPGPGYWVVNFVRRRRMTKMLDQCAAWLPCGRWDDTRWHPVGARLVPPAALAVVEEWLTERAVG
jgi:hypothetical protein